MSYVLGEQLLEDGIRLEKLRTCERLHAVIQLLESQLLERRGLRLVLHF
jgi:hypothetical protein